MQHAAAALEGSAGVVFDSRFSKLVPGNVSPLHLPKAYFLVEGDGALQRGEIHILLTGRWTVHQLLKDC